MAYTFLLCNSLDFTVIGEVPFSAAQWDTKLSAIGTFTGSLTLGDERIPAGVLDALGEVRTSLFVLRDDVAVWSGMVWVTDYNSKGSQLQVKASEFMSYWLHRQNVAGPWTATDQFQIVSDVMFYANAYGATCPPAFFVGQPSSTGVLRDYPLDPTVMMGDVIVHLAALDNGFEWAQDQSYTSGPAAQITMSYPTRGRSAAASGLMFEYPGNVISYRWPRDGTQLTTFGWIRQGNYVSSASYPLTGYPEMDAILPTVSNLSRPQIDAIVVGYTHARRGIQVLPQVVVNGNQDPAIGTYIVGDTCRLRLNDFRFAGGTVDISGARIIGIQTTLDPQGREMVTLTFGGFTVT